MKSFIINQNDKDQRLDKFLQKTIPKLSATLMYKYIRTKRIKVNHKRSEISYRLNQGDVVECYINDEFFTSQAEEDFMVVPPDISIIYEDDNIILIDKPLGLVVHEDDNNTVDTLINRVKRYLYDTKQFDPKAENSFAPALCNRIDRNTTGIVIVAKNAPSLRFINLLIKERQIKKYYLCVLSGILSPTCGTLTHYHFKDSKSNQVFISDTKKKNYKTMVTSYKLIDKTDKNSLVEVLLITGRTHQIRAHFAHTGHPIIGDGKYGYGQINKQYRLKYQALCSYKLRFEISSELMKQDFAYLNGKEFCVKSVPFADRFREMF